MSTPVLSLLDVAVHYEPHQTPIVAQVSFSAQVGERIALVGLNGCGKTTLLMSIVGLVHHEGEIRVGDQVLSPTTLSDIRQQIGFLFNVPEDQLLFPKVLEDVAFGLLRRGIPLSEAHERAREMLHALSIADLAEAPVHHLSHGQKQRVALAGSLITKPPLLLLDEPSAALDPPSKNKLVELLSAQDAAMIVATHDLDFANKLCTRFIMLDRGHVVLDGADISAVANYWNDFNSSVTSPLIQQPA